MVHNNDDAMNKIPLKSSNGLDDEEKNGGEFIHDTAAAEEARREEMRVNILKWMKKLTIVLICFIGLALIAYVIISLCFSNWPKSTPSNSTAAHKATSKQSTPIAALPEPVTPLPITIPETSSSSSSSTLSPTSSLPSTPPPSSTSNMPTNSSLSIADDEAAGNSNAESSTNASQVASSPSEEANTDINNNNIVASTTIKDSETTAMSPTLAPFLLKDTPPKAEDKFESKLGVFEKAAVCSDKEICSQIGSHILQQDGSAVDAAIATLLCNGITTMQSMGIGGGMLMNIYIKSEKHAYALDAREVAPFSANPDMFNQEINQSMHGGQSIAVPGELMGYHRAHERFGKLPWKALIEPSIKLCEEGFYMTHHLHNALNFKLQHLKNNTVITNVFMDEHLQLLPVGTKLKPPKELCQTYKTLAENGPLDFYNGTLAKLVAQDLKDLGSGIDYYDLESYSVDLVNAITMQLGDDILYSLPPISSGTVVANILSVLEGYNFTKADLKSPEPLATAIHRIAEALKFGFAKRWELGDMRFNDVRELVSKLTNPEHGAEIRGRINDSAVLPKISDYDAQFGGHDDMGTSHLTVVAPNGDAVSVTSSVNDYFGAGQAGPRTGIIFNSAMNDFSVAGQPNMFGLPSSPSNYIEERKRPMSSMSPTILADSNGDIRLALGAAGGTKIISAIVEVIVRVLWMGQNIKEAIDAPRFHHQLLPDSFQYEYGKFSEDVLKLLEARGQHTKFYKDVGSVVCGIMRNGTALYANADYRKRGGVAGF